MSYAPILTEPSLDEKNNFPNISHLSRTASRSASLRRRPKSFLPNGVPQGQAETYPFIVHCHLSWDWVWQRPQQFISRLGRTHKVLFVETAAPDSELAAPTARFRVPENFPNVTVLRLQFPAWRWG